MKYKLIVNVGSYQSDSLIGLLFEITKHRLKHLFNGDGWVD
tara:strand:+ start:130 stop:252 length:123 start_codon:yes stop_codon:yes gene_type:complete